MKFKFLLLTASCLSVGMIALQPGAQAINNPVPADKDRSCEQTAKAAKKAVVTLYSGLEIGSGSIVDANAENGTILTAYHVVKEAIAQPSKVKIYVKLANGNRYIGRVIDPPDKRNDLALVQISAKETLPTVRLASATSLSKGQQVCAIGSPSGRVGKLDEGRFKALLGNGDLQSDLRLTYGNSGGPLLNSNGELIGVNKSIGLSEQGKNTGTSFATSVQVAQLLIDKYNRSPSNSVAKQPAVSVPQPLPALPVAAIKPPSEVSQAQGSSKRLGASFDSSMTIQKVEIGSPAALWGLQSGDLITEIDGIQLTSPEQLQALLNGQPGTAILTIKRNQQVRSMQVNF